MSNQDGFQGREAELYPGSIDLQQESPFKFPFEAFEFDDPQSNSTPALSLLPPWKLSLKTIKAYDSNGLLIKDSSGNTIAKVLSDGVYQFDQLAALTDPLGDSDELIGSGDELWELNTPECVSSDGREPTEQSIVYEEARLRENGKPTYDNAWIKWPGRGVVGVFRATTNLVTDPEDLTTSNWVDGSTSRAITDHYFGGKRFTRITKTAASQWCAAYQTILGLTTSTPSIHVILRNNNVPSGEHSLIDLYDNTAGAGRYVVEVTWSTKSVVVTTGTLVAYQWYGDDIVEISGVATGVVTGNSNRMSFYPDSSTTTICSVDCTAVQIENLTYPTPYTPTSRPSGALVAPFSWDQQGTIELWVRPWFTYDIGIDKYVVSDYDGSSVHAVLLYAIGADKWRFSITDGTTSINLYSAQVLSNAALWKWWHLKVTWDTVNDSYKFWVDGALVDSSTTALTAITFNNNISIGSIPKYTSPAGYQADALITDLLYKDTVDETTTHYTNGRPYYAQNRLLGANCEWRIP